MIILSFFFFLIVFIIIGLLSLTENKHTSADYLLADHDIKPWLVALSAVATNNSGYMFIGMIGYTYVTGISSMWLLIGWISGDFVMSYFIHKKLRIMTESRNSLSFVSTLGQWHGTDYKIFKFIGGLLTLLFLGTYAAAQLKAGSKALHVLFNWDYSVGAIIGALMVLAYCFAGGIRASIWTDAAQSFVMIISMLILCIASVNVSGGLSSFSETLNHISPSYMSILPEDVLFTPLIGAALFILSWFFAGVGVIGQPHIMIRFMSMDSAENMKRVRIYYYSWYIAFCTLTIGAGLAARVLIPEMANFDAELALPKLAQQLLPDVFVGLVLAGLFAATMSTADSQILSCTASITQDMGIGKPNSYIGNKIATIFVTAVALTIALIGNKNVFSLVLIAWSALGSAFAPLLILYILGAKPSELMATTTMLFGLAAMLVWRHFGLTNYIFEIGPGILAGFIPYILYSICSRLLKFNR